MPPGWVSCWPWRANMGQLPLQVGVRFVALSAGVPDLAGSQDYLDRMSPREKQQTRLVVNVQQLIAGDSCLQRKVSAHFPQGTVRYQSQRDNVLWLDRHLHGQLARRTHDSLFLLRPLLRDLTGAAQSKAAAKRDRRGRQA